jgi:hypothetical protein
MFSDQKGRPTQCLASLWMPSTLTPWRLGWKKTIKVFHVVSTGYQGIDQINLNVWSCGIDDLVVEAF